MLQHPSPALTASLAAKSIVDVLKASGRRELTLVLLVDIPTGEVSEPV